MSGPHRSGPVRSDDARRAILAATAEQFVAKGYEGLTIQGVAAAARVGKQTIYRWWSSKADLLAECLVDGPLWDRDLAVPDTGDLAADVRTWLALMLDVDTPGAVGRLLLPLIGAAAGDEGLARNLEELLHGGREGGLDARFAAAVRAGDLPEDADPQLIADALVGFLVVRTMARMTTTHADVVRLVAHVLGPAGR
jgi:AcrR family transcriptional regulator